MSEERVHGPEGGRHGCVQCRRPYWCDMVHALAGERVLSGARCCPDCRVQNMKDARKLQIR